MIIGKMDYKKNFWDNELEPGYYEKILSKGLDSKIGIQSNWHNLTFLKIKKFLTKGKNHLDYACGPGSLIGNYSNSNSIGYDIAEEQINYANKKFSSENKKFTSNKDEILKKEYFDIITVNGLFEYLTNEEILDLLNFLNQILKKNGKIIITTPNYFGIFKLIEVLGEIIGGVEYSKVNINKFTKKRVLSLLAKSKFNNYQVSKFMNLGVFFSLFGHELGRHVERYLDKLFFSTIGMLLLIKIEK